MAVTQHSMSKATGGFQSFGLALSEHPILNQRKMVFKWENLDLLCETD